MFGAVAVCVKQKGLLCDRKGERANVTPNTQEAPLMRLSVATLRRVVKGDLRVEFVRQQLTSYGGLELLRRYVRRLDLRRRLHAACAAAGGDYGGGRPGGVGLGRFFLGARGVGHPRDLPDAPRRRPRCWAGGRALP